MNLKEQIKTQFLLFSNALKLSQRKGALNPKALITLLVATAMLGGTAVTIFQGVNSTNLSNSPNWFIITAPIVVGAVIILWLVKGMR